MKKLLILWLLAFTVGAVNGQIRIDITYQSDTIVSEPDGIYDEDLEKNSFRDKEFLVYPLKTSAVINVIRLDDAKRAYTGIFTDETGRIIRKVQLDAINNQITLKKLNYGMYILRIEPEEKSVAEVKPQ